MTDEIEESCGNCRWWHRRAPSLATATRSMLAEDYIGACQLYAPTVILNAGRPFSYYPETSEHRWCGDWDAPDVEGGPDGGEEITEASETDGKVVPMRRTAA